MALLHFLSWSSLRVVLPSLVASRYNVSLWVRFVSRYISSFFFLLCSPFCPLPHLSASLYSLLSIIPTSFTLLAHPPHPTPPPWQTYPITRTITIKAKLWIKGMISPQWPMPWQGWVPLRLSQPCPAELDPSPVCTTALCSAQAARRPSRGSRWNCSSEKHTLLSYSVVELRVHNHLIQYILSYYLQAHSQHLSLTDVLWLC